VGLDEDEIYAMLKISDQPGEDGSLNTGNQVTNDLKLLIKAGRLVGVHVSPTVMFNVSQPKLPVWRRCINNNHRDLLSQTFRAASQRKTGRSGCRRTLFDLKNRNCDEVALTLNIIPSNLDIHT